MSIKITLPAVEMYDSKTQTFIDEPEITIELEHSLVSLSKWEAQTNKAFLGPAEKTSDETLLYVHAMCVDQSVPYSTILRITQEDFERINDYIDKSQTATWFKEPPGPQRPSREVVTAELVYHWMIAMNVPKEFEHWHLARLFTQLKVISEKNKPPKKQSRKEVMAQHRALNEANRARLGTNG